MHSLFRLLAILYGTRRLQNILGSRTFRTDRTGVFDPLVTSTWLLVGDWSRCVSSNGFICFFGLWLGRVNWNSSSSTLRLDVNLSSSSGMYLRFVETDVACCVVSMGGLGCRSVGNGLISGAIIELDFFFLRVSRVGGSNGSGSSGISLLIWLLNVDSGGDGLECSMGASSSSGMKLNCGGESRMLWSSWTRLSSSWGLKRVLATWNSPRISKILTLGSAEGNICPRQWQEAFHLRLPSCLLS